jgi:hypothetical protein
MEEVLFFILILLGVNYLFTTMIFTWIDTLSARKRKRLNR